jgi:hypothetical protein
MANVDENLRQYATDRQWEVYLAFCEAGSGAKAAADLGVDRRYVDRTIKALTERALRAGAAPDGYQVTRVSAQYDASGDKTGSSVVVKAAAVPADVVHLPDPKKIIKTSTLYAGDGSVTQQWVLEKPEDVQREKLWTRFADTLVERVPSREPVASLKSHSHADLLAVYPVGDQHHGMAAWANEAGKDWDLKISDRMIRAAASHLIGQCPPCDTALIPFLGDFFHYDSYKPLTPAHGHVLDADSRFPKMIDTGWLVVEHIILAALERHKNVHVIWEAGNHDEATAPVTRRMLKRLFRDNKRVTIDQSDAFWHYFEFGKVMLFTNHGDKCKPTQQLGVVAHDQPEMWGRTIYRMGMLGHRHHEARTEYPGGIVETFGVLPPADAYAHRGGYRSMQQMHALVFHKAGRLQQRNMFYPDMVDAA